MSDFNIRPRRIEWAAPEGWTIWADEDGVHLRTPSGDSLEQPDVLRLIDVYTGCRRAFEDSDVLPPRPPSREELRQMSDLNRAKWTTKNAIRAMTEAIQPF